MPAMKKTPILHPFFLAAYPVIFLLSHNLDQVDPAQAPRPLIVLLLLAAVLLLFFGVSSREWGQAGLTTTLLLFLLLSYGHVLRLLQQVSPLAQINPLLGLFWFVLLTAGMWLKWRIRQIAFATHLLNIVTGVALLLPLVNVGVYLAQTGAAVPEKTAAPPIEVEDTARTAVTNEFPDIYYIIVDGYGRSDILQTFYQQDNQELITFLTSHGFYVADHSHSNYVQTALSLASSLNMQYVDALSGPMGEPPTSRADLAELIENNQLRHILNQFDYELVSFATGYGPTEIANAEVYIPFQPEIINDLEGMLLAGSAAMMLGEKFDRLFNPFACEVQRGGILNIFDHLGQLPASDKPRLVFAHIMSPHPPFVFGPNGEAVKVGECDGKDGSFFRDSREEYASGYGQQVQNVSRLLMQTVERILAASNKPPIIVIQADHGPGMFLDWDSPERSCIKERTSILNAYYLPGADQDQLYRAITPVNSFRIILDSYFGTELGALEDRSFYSAWDRPFDFIDVTGRLENSCTP